MRTKASSDSRRRQCPMLFLTLLLLTTVRPAASSSKQPPNFWRGSGRGHGRLFGGSSASIIQQQQQQKNSRGGKHSARRPSSTALFTSPSNITENFEVVEENTAAASPTPVFPVIPQTTATSFFEYPLQPVETDVGKKDETENPSTPSSKSDRLDRIHVRFAVASMALAGLVEGFALKAYGSFPNMMTGNCVKLVELLSSGGDLNKIVYYSTMIVLYVTGGSVFAQWSGYVDSKKKDNSLLSNGVGAMACATFLLSDTMGGGIATRLPLLALAFGILHAFTIAKIGVIPFAMTGHLTKIGVGVVKPSSPVHATSKGYHTSVKGLLAFLGSAFVANVLYNAGPRIPFKAPPFGVTLAVLYGGLFRWLDVATRRIENGEEVSKQA